MEEEEEVRSRRTPVKDLRKRRNLIKHNTRNTEAANKKDSYCASVISCNIVC